MKVNESIYDLIWAEPIEIETNDEFIGWVYAEFAMKIAEINAGREKREREERLEDRIAYKKHIPMWKKLIGVF